MKKFIFSGFTDEFSNDFDKQIQAAKAFGMDMIELRGADGDNVSVMTTQQIKGYAAKLADNGLGVSAIGSPLGKITLDGDMDGHMETARKVFEFANILGASNIRMFSFYGAEGTDVTACRQQVIDSLGRMIDIAKSAGVVLCHENEAKIYGDIPERCLDLMNAFGGDLKCVLDMGNFVLEKVNPWDAYQTLKDHIRYFHIKDALAAGAVVPPGKGEAQIQKILLDYAADHEGVLFTLEPHLQTFDGLNALVGQSFENPYKYPDCETAFTDAVGKIKQLLSL